MKFEGDMKGNINAAMAAGVEHAAIVCSFNTPSYIASVNCSKELIYADNTNCLIVPININESIVSYHNNGDSSSKWLGDIIKRRDLQPLVLMDQSYEEEFAAGLEALYERLRTMLTAYHSKMMKLGYEDEVAQGRGGGVVDDVIEGVDVSGYYEQLENRYPMVLQFLALKSGQVYGQGDDEVAALQLYTLE